MYLRWLGVLHNAERYHIQLHESRPYLPHHIPDLGQLIHKVDPVMQPPGGVDKDNIRAPGHGGLHSVVGYRCRISPHPLLHDVNPSPFGPDDKLFDGGGAEGIGCPDDDLLSLGGEHGRDLADRR